MNMTIKGVFLWGDQDQDHSVIRDHLNHCSSRELMDLFWSQNDSSVPLMAYDLNDLRSLNPNPDHSKEMHTKFVLFHLLHTCSVQ